MFELGFAGEKTEPQFEAKAGIFENLVEEVNRDVRKGA